MGKVMQKVQLEGANKSIEIEALFDSGSTYGHIKRSVAEEIGLMKIPYDLTLELIDKRRITTKAAVGSVTIKGCTHPILIAVVEEATPSLSIGYVQMQAMGIKIDPKREEITVECEVPKG